MQSKCDNCKIRLGCDFLSGLCRLSPAEIVTHRPDLIGRRRAMTSRERAARAYKRDPAKKIAQVREWQKNNRQRLNEYQRGYYGKG